MRGKLVTDMDAMLYVELMLAGRPVDALVQTVRGCAEFNALERWEIVLTAFSPIHAIDQLACLWVSVDGVHAYVHGVITSEIVQPVTSEEFAITLELSSPLTTLTQIQKNRVYPADVYSRTLQVWLDEWAGNATLSGTWPRHGALTAYGMSNWELIQNTLINLQKLSYLVHDKQSWSLKIDDALPMTEIIRLSTQLSSGLTTSDWRALSCKKWQGEQFQWIVETNHPLLKLGDRIQLDQEPVSHVVRVEWDLTPERFRNRVVLQEQWVMPTNTVAPVLREHFAEVANDNLQLKYWFSSDATLTDPARLLQPGSQAAGRTTQIFPKKGANAFIGYLDGDLQQPIIKGFHNIPSVLPEEHSVWRSHQGYEILMEAQGALRFSAPQQRSVLAMHPESGLRIRIPEGDLRFESQGDWLQSVGKNLNIQTTQYSLQAGNFQHYSENSDLIESDQISMHAKYDQKWKVAEVAKMQSETVNFRCGGDFQIESPEIFYQADDIIIESEQEIFLDGEIIIQVGDQKIEIRDDGCEIQANKIYFDAKRIEIGNEAEIN